MIYTFGNGADDRTGGIWIAGTVGSRVERIGIKESMDEFFFINEGGGDLLRPTLT